MSKLSTAGYAVRAVKSFRSQESLRMIYFSYVHSVMMCGIIFFWGGGRKLSYSSNIFKIQKRIIRVITKSRSRDYCPELFKKLNILPLQAQYMFSLLLFVIKNRELYKSSFEIHNINTDIVRLLIYILLYRS